MLRDGRMRAVRVAYMPWRRSRAYRSLWDRITRPYWVQNMVDGREGGAVGPLDYESAIVTRYLNATAYGLPDVDVISEKPTAE